MLQPWRTGTVIRIENESSATRRFWIQVADTEQFDFKPGQFVTLDLPIHEKPNRRWRSYSIASWPDGTNVFELVIVLLEGGAGTTYLFHEINVGSQLTFRGALGVFVLPDPIERDLFFICTGTGIAPFRSMAHHIRKHNISHQEIYLMCDDVKAEVKRLSGKGVACGPISDEGWGLLTSINLPGGAGLGLYEPRHPTALGLRG